MRGSGGVVVSWQFNDDKTKSILIVGEQKNGKMEVINAIQGLEAERIVKLLTTKKETNK